MQQRCRLPHERRTGQLLTALTAISTILAAQQARAQPTSTAAPAPAVNASGVAVAKATQAVAVPVPAQQLQTAGAAQAERQGVPVAAAYLADNPMVRRLTRRIAWRGQITSAVRETLLYLRFLGPGSAALVHHSRPSVGAASASRR